MQERGQGREEEDTRSVSSGVEVGEEAGCLVNERCSVAWTLSPLTIFGYSIILGHRQGGVPYDGRTG